MFFVCFGITRVITNLSRVNIRSSAPILICFGLPTYAEKQQCRPHEPVAPLARSFLKQISHLSRAISRRPAATHRGSASRLPPALLEPISRTKGYATLVRLRPTGVSLADTAGYALITLGPTPKTAPRSSTIISSSTDSLLHHDPP